VSALGATLKRVLHRLRCFRIGKPLKLVTRMTALTSNALSTFYAAVRDHLGFSYWRLARGRPAILSVVRHSVLRFFREALHSLSGTVYRNLMLTQTLSRYLVLFFMLIHYSRFVFLSNVARKSFRHFDDGFYNFFPSSSLLDNPSEFSLAVNSNTATVFFYNSFK
jgi:hypothetical protein